eukprot:364574-Chlamydomonas_euryale.AAC.4
MGEAELHQETGCDVGHGRGCGCDLRLCLLCLEPCVAVTSAVTVAVHCRDHCRDHPPRRFGPRLQQLQDSFSDAFK